TRTALSLHDHADRAAVGARRGFGQAATEQPHRVTVQALHVKQRGPPHILRPLRPVEAERGKGGKGGVGVSAGVHAPIHSRWLAWSPMVTAASRSREVSVF